MKKQVPNRKFEEGIEPYLDQAAWLARIFARISIVFALAVSAATLVTIFSLADSGFNAFEIMIIAAMVIAAIILASLSIWLASKARNLAAAVEKQLNLRRSER